MKAKRRGRKTRSAEIDDFNREIELTRQNRQIMKLLETRAKQKETISLEEAKLRLDIG